MSEEITITFETDEDVSTILSKIENCIGGSKISHLQMRVLSCPLCRLLKQVSLLGYRAQPLYIFGGYMIVRCAYENIRYIWMAHAIPTDEEQQEMFRDVARRFPEKKIDWDTQQGHFGFHLRGV